MTDARTAPPRLTVALTFDHDALSEALDGVVFSRLDTYLESWRRSQSDPS